MKIYKIEIAIIDFDGLGADGIVSTLENQRYPNDSISLDVKGIQSHDIGEWSDDHPLNHRSSKNVEYQRLFEQAPEGVT
jgi:hypothetical protein